MGHSVDDAVHKEHINENALEENVCYWFIIKFYIELDTKR